MFSPDIKYAFNQIELSLIGFSTYMKKHLQRVIPDLPVYFQNTGDFSYMINKKFVETKNEDLLMKTPRLVLKLEDIQPNPTENTNQYNKIFYHFDGKNYQAVVRRLCYNLTLTSSFVSPNLISLLNHTEIMATMVARDNVYTYEFLGNTIQAAFVVQGFNNDIPSIDMGQGGTRNAVIMNNIELQIHLIVPRLESIIPAEEALQTKTVFGIDALGNESEFTTEKQLRENIDLKIDDFHDEIEIDTKPDKPKRTILPRE